MLVNNNKMENTSDRNIQVNTMKLWEASYLDDIELGKDILNNKEVEIKGVYYGDTPLIHAVRKSLLTIVRRLLEYPGIQIGKRVGDDPTALHKACDYNKALHYDCYEEQVSIVQLPCQDRRCCPGVDNKNRDGRTPLMLAIYHRRPDIVKFISM